MPTRILVIDDDLLICRLLEYQLGGLGYEVITYQQPYAALLELSRWQPDLLLLDVMMPEISGWDLCRQIRASSSVPIIMLTAKDGDDDVVRGLTGGADDYVGKPFSQAQLAARIEAVLRRAKGAPARGRTGNTPTREAAPQVPTVAPAAPAAAVIASAPLAGGAAATATTIPLPAPAQAQAAPRAAPRPAGRSPRLGLQLAEARQRLGYSLHEAARASGVRWEFLQAIEQEEFGYVPRADLRHALRAYSALLSVDLKPYAARANRRRARPAPLHLTVGMVALIALALVLIAVVM